MVDRDHSALGRDVGGADAADPFALEPIDLSAPGFAWAADPRIAKIMAALDAARPHGARYVGGCVRDGLVGATAQDVDIATQMRPDQTLAALKAAGVRAIPTGVDHGTVTAVCDGATAEVTSLRADIATDGRRAAVSFTEDWRLDAVRRDFTINAFYLTTDGGLYDPWAGRRDLAAGEVRFIGVPAQRIKEDYLRILRFFRFSARFASGDFDQDGMEACADLAGGLDRLSRERVGQELLRLIEGPNAGGALRRMAAAGVLTRIYSSTPQIDHFSALGTNVEASLGLAALWPQGVDADGAGLGAALRLPNAYVTRARNALATSDRLVDALKGARADELPVTAAVEFAYRYGVIAVRDGLRLVAARRGETPPLAALARLEKIDVPVFPVAGDDVIIAGAPPGPAIGHVLADVEGRWIDAGFPRRDDPAADFDKWIGDAIGRLDAGT